jgi:hypothetical protein
MISRHSAALHGVARRPDTADSTMPFWGNGYFSNLDAAALVAFLLETRPQRYIEVGSGNSTKFARYAISLGHLHTRMTSIDPEPRAEIDGLCDRVIRTTLQACDREIFAELDHGDIMFFDGSHVLGMQSDVSTFFLEILPSLKPGILVQVHDIFLPYDYAPVFHGRRYNEQYVLAMFLLYGRPEIVLPNYFICMNTRLSDSVRGIFKSPGRGIDIPFCYGHGLPGVSLWFRTTRSSQWLAQSEL